MGLLESVLVVTLDGTCEALALAYARNVDNVALSENVSLQNIANVYCADVVQTELLKCLLERYVVLLEVTLFRLVEVLGSNISEAELNCLVAVVLSSLLLNYYAGTRFDNCYGNDLACLVEDLCHADLLADDCLCHCG